MSGTTIRVCLPLLCALSGIELNGCSVADQLAALRTRPLCLYPKVARWNGKGSIDEAGNFACSTPPAE
ncbi:MAG TPA: hypothetical protein VE058_12310 [Steroidobacteraceae bacterium]|nr:hypothetical protein [Steroidobacteraceae bacterium]